MSLPSVIQPASNSSTAVGFTRAAAAGSSLFYVQTRGYGYVMLNFSRWHFWKNEYIIMKNPPAAVIKKIPERVGIFENSASKSEWLCHRKCYRIKQGKKSFTLAHGKQYHRFPSSPYTNKGVRVSRLFSRASNPHSWVDLFICMCLALGPNLLREKEKEKKGLAFKLVDLAHVC